MVALNIPGFNGDISRLSVNSLIGFMFSNSLVFMGSFNALFTNLSMFRSENSFSRGELLFSNCAKRLGRGAGRPGGGLWSNSGRVGSRKPAALIRASRACSLSLLNISASSSRAKLLLELDAESGLCTFTPDCLTNSLTDWLILLFVRIFFNGCCQSSTGPRLNRYQR